MYGSPLNFKSTAEMRKFLFEKYDSPEFSMAWSLSTPVVKVTSKNKLLGIAVTVVTGPLTLPEMMALD